MWFQLPSLIELTDPSTLVRALQLYRVQKVLTLEGQPGTGGEPGHWQLAGDVQGTQRAPYRVVVDLYLMPDGETVDRWGSACSCPVGARCKHAVALLIKAAYHGQRLVSGARDVNAPVLTPDARAAQTAALERQRKQAAELQLRQQQALLAERWLQDGERLPKTDVRPGAPYGLGRTRETVMTPMYLLRLDASQPQKPKLRIGLGASSPKVKGGWTKPRPVSPSYFRGAYGERQRFDLTERDHDILALLGALPTTVEPYRYGGADDWRLDTVAAALVLERASTTGRLFWREEGGGIGEPTAWGEPLSLSWRWQEQVGNTPEDSLWQLEPQLSAPQAVLCANQPMLYLDRSGHACGPVSGGGDAQAQALLEAPALPLHVLQKNPVALLRRLGSAVAPPPVLPTLRRVGGVPRWRLHLSRQEAQEPGEPHASQALCLQLDFDYEGCQGWWQHDQTPLVFEREDGERVLLQRDLTSEAQALQRLYDLDLQPRYEGIFVLSDRVSPARWLHWADAQFQPLRDAGFSVEMDADLRHWVRPAGELK